MAGILVKTGGILPGNVNGKIYAERLLFRKTTDKLDNA